MKVNILKSSIIAVGLALACAANAEPLEPLIPFEEALAKAQAGEGAGYYALAMHYGKGGEVDANTDAFRKFLAKAVEKDYGNAVMLQTLIDEPSRDVTKDAESIRNLLRRDGRISDYAGWSVNDYGCGYSITNEADIAKIRAGYEKAFSLGVMVATNELARFNERVEQEKQGVERVNQERARKTENAKLAQALIQDEPAKVKAEGKNQQQKNGSDKEDKATGRELFAVLPFNEALEKISANDPSGYFSMAFHYSRGKDVKMDSRTSQMMMEKAAELNYGPAVFIKAMEEEGNIIASPATYRGQLYNLNLKDCVKPNINKYLDEDYGKRGCYGKYYLSFKAHYCITNDNDVAAICEDYERAFALGINSATNELARFKRNVELGKKYLDQISANNDRVAANMEKVKGVVGDLGQQNSVLQKRNEAARRSNGGLLNRVRREQTREREPLYKLPPFGEALEKSKAGEGEGFFALALHYAKGDEVDRKEKYCQPMIEKAASLGFKVAMLVKVMNDEPQYDNIAPDDRIYDRLRGAGCSSANTSKYLDARYYYPWETKYSITNENDVATICAEYERLYSLGVEVATNELARFKKNVAAVKQVYEEIRLQKENKKLNTARAEGELRDFFQELELAHEEERRRKDEEMRRQREAEREEQREQLRAIQEELRRAREEKEAGGK